MVYKLLVLKFLSRPSYTQISPYRNNKYKTWIVGKTSCGLWKKVLKLKVYWATTTTKQSRGIHCQFTDLTCQNDTCSAVFELYVYTSGSIWKQNTIIHSWISWQFRYIIFQNKIYTILYEQVFSLIFEKNYLKALFK